MCVDKYSDKRHEEEYLDEFIVEVGDGLTGLFTELMNMWMLIHLHVSPGLCA